MMDGGTEAGREGVGDRGAQLNPKSKARAPELSPGTAAGRFLCRPSGCVAPWVFGAWLAFDDAGGRGSSDPSFAPSSDLEWYEL